jgi:hypothetical protein
MMDVATSVVPWMERSRGCQRKNYQSLFCVFCWISLLMLPTLFVPFFVYARHEKIQFILVIGNAKSKHQSTWMVRRARWLMIEKWRKRMRRLAVNNPRIKKVILCSLV